MESLQEQGLGISVEGLGHVQDIRDCARAISDVYREIPSDRTAERQAKLQRGVKRFLEM